MEKTLREGATYETPELRTVVDTTSGGAAEQPAGARGDPTAPSDDRSRRMRGIGYGAIAVVLVIVGALLYTTRNELGDAREEIASLERETAAIEEAAAEAAQVAASGAAELEDRIDELGALLATTEGELASTSESLSDTQSQATELEREVARLGSEVAAAEGDLASTRDDLAKLDALTALQLAWRTWGTSPDFFRRLERQEIDVAAIDDSIRSLGLAEDWESWAGTNFLVAARMMGNYVRAIDDPVIEEAWDAWVECSTMESCTKAAVELDGAMTAALATTMASLRATTGVPRTDGI